MLAFYEENSWQSYLNSRVKGDLQEFGQNLTNALQNGEIILPQSQSTNVIRTGGTNYCPNSDFSWSKDAAETPGTTPASAGNGNQEAWRIYRQPNLADVAETSAGALKAVGHSLYAADEGVNAYVPVWDRVNGWCEIGADDEANLHDIAIKLINKIVKANQTWVGYFRCVSLDATLIPANVEFYAGVWEARAGSQDWITGDMFQLSYVNQTPGSTAIDYVVVAKTDSGVSIISQTLSITDAPDTLSRENHIKLFFNAGAGFIQYDIYRKIGSEYFYVYTVKNSTDLQYNDIGQYVYNVKGFPVITDTAPQAYAETRNARIGAFGGAWTIVPFSVAIPPGYDFSQTVSQYLRIGLTNPMGVNRHLAIDRIWFSTQNGEWAEMPYNYANDSPTILPTSGNQGGGGVYDPPDPGSGGGRCIAVDTPVLLFNRGRGYKWKAFERCLNGMEIEGGNLLPNIIIQQKNGNVAEHYLIKTQNGIVIKCTTNHRLIRHREDKTGIAARDVQKGNRLLCWENGRIYRTEVVYKKLIPMPLEIGTFSLRHAGGLAKDGQGFFVAGYSRKHDRGLFHHNEKPVDDILF